MEATRPSPHQRGLRRRTASDLHRATCEPLERRQLLSTTTISWGALNQSIIGFGASSAWTTQNLTTSQSQLLFSPTAGAGLTSLRSRINEDSSTSNPPAAAGTYELQTMDWAAQANASTADQVQTLTLCGASLGGTFTLSYSGQTTGQIAYNASATALASALRGLSNIGSTGVSVTAIPCPFTVPGVSATVTPASFSIAFNTTTIASPALISINSANLTGSTITANIFSTGGITQWSTPWSPPAAWKSNGSVDNGGYLLPADYQSYANYLAAYVEYIDTAGNEVNGSWPKISLSDISLQNEPDENVSYDSCTWTAAQLAAFLPDAYAALTNLRTSNLIPATDPIPGIILPEESGWHWEIANTVMTTPSLNADVAVYADHDYDNGSGVVSGAAGKQVWMTEVYDGNSATGISAGLWVAQNIYNMIVTSDANSYDYWWIQDGSAGGNEQLLGPNWSQTQLFWGEANYAKFIRPGWNNITQTNDGGITASAYKDLATNQFATVLINSSSSPITETINLSGAYTSVLTPYVTSATLNLAQQTPIPTTGNGSTFTYNIPAQSIVTLTGTGSTTPVSAIPAGLTATPNGTAGMSLAWTNNISGATGYTLQRSTNDSTWTTVSSSIPSGTYSYPDTGLSSNTLYYYRVYPNNSTTDYSNVSYALTAPTPVTGVTSSYSTSTLNVTLQWTASTTPGVDYEVERSSNGGITWTGLTSAVSNGTNTYTDTTAPEAATLEYQVFAIDGANTSAGATTTVTTTIVRAPSGLTAGGGSNPGSVALNWTNNSNEPTTTYIERSSNGGGNWSVLGSVASGVNSYTDPNPGAGTFEYQVQSFYNSIYSAFSNTASFTVSVLALNGTSGNNTLYFKDSGGTLDIWINSATPGSGTPTQTAALASYTSLTVSGGTGNDTVTLDYSGGDPTTGSFSFPDGSGTPGTDTLIVKGGSGAQTAALGASALTLGSDTISYSNLSYLDLDLGSGSSTFTANAPGTSPLLTLTMDSGATVTLGASSTLAINTIVSDSGSLNLSGESESIDQINGSGTVTSSGGTLTVGSNNGTSTFAGIITGNLSVDKTGIGTFTNTGTSNYTGNTTVDTGTLSFAPISGSDSIGSSTSNVWVAPANTDNGTLDIGPNANLTCGGIYAGLWVGCNNANVNGGGIGVINQTGGTLSVAASGNCVFGGGNTVNNGASGTWNFSAGTANINANLRAAVNEDSTATLNISGTANLNLLTNSSINLGQYYGRTATINQTGGNVSFYSNAGTTLGGAGSIDITGAGYQVYNLDGGDLSLPSVSWTAAGGGAGGGSLTFNLSGGTLQTTVASTDFFPTGHVTVTVGSAGGIIDTFGNTVTINEILRHAGTPAIDGGLTLDDTRGTGELILSANSTYTGPTSVVGGTLDVKGAVADSASLGVNSTSLAAALILDGANALSAAAPITGTGASATITVNSTQTIASINSAGSTNLNAGTITLGTIDGTGTLSVNGTAVVSATHIRQAILNVASGASLAINASTSPGTTTATSILTDLYIAGTLNLNNNDLIVADTTQYSTIKAEIANSYDGGAWDQTGITSSNAKSNSATYGLGYAQATTIGDTTFDGFNVASGAVLVKYTLLGDTDLRGTVGIGDYDTVESNFGTLQDWSGGNFHYGGNVGIGDYNDVLNNFGSEAGSSLAAGSSLTQTTAASSVASNGTAMASAVPKKKTTASLRPAVVSHTRHAVLATANPHRRSASKGDVFAADESQMVTGSALMIDGGWSGGK